LTQGLGISAARLGSSYNNLNHRQHPPPNGFNLLQLRNYTNRYYWSEFYPRGSATGEGTHPLSNGYGGQSEIDQLSRGLMRTPRNAQYH
jgi:hypothetical protein